LELTKILFAQRRKTILNNLRAGRDRLSQTDWPGLLADLALDSGRRAETLSIAELASLANQVELLN
jgi:16S rRNA (adenine1518-N6/adenine1519-N6)-dimethyltransferase